MHVLRLLSLAPLALAAVLPRDEPVNYDGYKVYRVATKGDADGLLNSLSTLSYDQWNERLGDHLDISVSKDNVAKFESLGLEYTVMHEDLGADILEEASSLTSASTSRLAGALPDSTWFNSYHSYNDHVQYWRDLNAAFPKNSQYFVAGKSYQNRDIFGVKLFGNNTGTKKDALIWHGSVHAREWIAGMTVEFIAASIVDGTRPAT
jgi:hypothetical protein